MGDYISPLSPLTTPTYHPKAIALDLTLVCLVFSNGQPPCDNVPLSCWLTAGTRASCLGGESINVGFQVDTVDKCAETPGTSSLKVWISNECLHHPVWYIYELFSKLLSPFLVDPPIVNWRFMESGYASMITIPTSVQAVQSRVGSCSQSKYACHLIELSSCMKLSPVKHDWAYWAYSSQPKEQRMMEASRV